MVTVSCATFPEGEAQLAVPQRAWRNDSCEGVSAAQELPRRSRAQLTVKKTSTALVVPNPEILTSHPEWLPLTNLDRVVNPTFISVIFFYENVLGVDGWAGIGQTFGAVTVSLKAALSRALVDFYPLAGRLMLKDDTGLMDLRCNDEGAIFIEAAVNVRLDELGGPQPMPLLSGMDVLDDAVQWASGKIYVPDHITPVIPVLVVQVTRFSCGSIAVAVNWHHTVADAYSGCHFVRSWSQFTTGQQPVLKPVHDRHLLRPRFPLDSSTASNSHYNTNHDHVASVRQTVTETDQLCTDGHEQASIISSSTEQVIDAAIKDKSDANSAPAAAGAPEVKPFLLYKNTVRDLKKRILDEVDGACTSPSFTTAESVSAALWALMTRARSVPSKEFLREQRSRFFLFVDGRKKLGLPPGYFGNVVCSACAESSQGELLAKPLSYAASLIQTAKNSVDGDYFRSLIDLIEEQRSRRTESKSAHVTSVGYDVGATFWNFFPLYEINFGWGKPVFSVRNAPPRELIDGISMMPGPNGSTENMVALLNLGADRMQNLENDPQFRDAVQPLDFYSRSMPTLVAAT